MINMITIGLIEIIHVYLLIVYIASTVNLYFLNLIVLVNIRCDFPSFCQISIPGGIRMLKAPRQHCMFSTFFQ